jgi:glyoxylase-like metal-dependent hydrolase (beta-lactamase superfamily II)
MNAVAIWPRDDVRTVVNRDFHSNTYLLKTGTGKECVVVDPGLDREAIAQDLNACGWLPVAVLCTHGHFDHIGSAAWLQSDFRVPVYLLASDLKLAKMSNFMLSAFKLKQRIELPEFQLIHDGGGSVECGDRTFVFNALPGHTPGSVGISTGDLFFSGDSLYARRTALSRLPGEDHAVLRTSLKNLFTWLDGGVRVLPGHGESATLDEIHSQNQELRAFMTAP